MIKKLFSIVFSVLFLFVFTLTAYAEESFIINDYESQLITYEELVNLAKKGVLINDEYNKVIMKEEVFNDGTVMTSIIVIQKETSILYRNGKLIQRYTVRASRTLTNTEWTDVSTVYQELRYEYSTFGGASGAKLTGLYHKWYNDAANNINVYLLNSSCGQSGVWAYSPSGAFTGSENTSIQTYNPSANNLYGKNTGFSNYVWEHQGLAAMNSYVTYQTSDGANQFGPYHVYLELIST